MASINRNKSEVYPLEHISRIFLDFSMPSSGRAEEDFIASTVFQYLPSHVPKLSIDPPCLKRTICPPSHLFLIVIIPSICMVIYGRQKARR